VAVSLTESPGTLRPMLRLAAPVLVEQFLLMLVGFSDTILTGHYLEQEHLAAMNLIAYLLWLSFGIFATVAIGSTAMVARFVGAGDWLSARRVTNQAFLVGAVLAGGVTLLGMALVPGLPKLMQLEGEAARLATVYLWFLVPVLPMVMIEAVGVACLRGAGDMLSGLVVMASTNAVNIAVSWALVLGPGPIPKLGWEGIAVGTACGHTFGALLIVAMMARGRSGLAVRWPMLGPDRDLIRRLLRVGVPGGMDTLLIIFCHLWFVAVINRLGDLAAAAHGVAIRIESLAFLSGTAFQVAATTMSGQYLGACDHRKAGRSVLLACLVGGGVMTAAGLIFFAIPLPLARLFVRADQLDVALTAVPLLRIVALAHRGAGHARAGRCHDPKRGAPRSRRYALAAVVQPHRVPRRADSAGLLARLRAALDIRRNVDARRLEPRRSRGVVRHVDRPARPRRLGALPVLPRGMEARGGVARGGPAKE